MYGSLFYIIILILFIYIFYFFKFRKYELSNLKILGPKGALPILGNLHQLGSPKTLLKKLTELSIKYNHCYRIWFGDQYYIVVSDPVIIKEIYVNNFENFKNRPNMKFGYLNGYFGTGTASGEIWDNNKLVVSKALRKSNINLSEFIKTKVDEFLNTIESKFNSTKSIDQDDNEFVVFENPRFYFQRYSYSIIYKFLFNENLMEDNKELLVFFKLMKDFLKVATPNLLDYNNFFQTIYFEYVKHTNKQNKILKSYIRNKYINYLNEMKNLNILDNSDENFKPKCLLESLIMEYGKDVANPSDQLSIIGTISEFIFAGSETSSSQMEFIFLELINNKEYQEKIYAELKSLNKDKITFQDRLKTPLFNSFLKEVLRVHPPVPLGLPRLTLEDCIIDNKLFPKDSQIVINHKGLSLNENCFVNANTFNPKRFLNNSMETDNFMTFGLGYRNCPGQNVNSEETNTLISNLILNYKFDSIDGKQIPDIEKVTLTLNPKKFNIKIIKR